MKKESKILKERLSSKLSKGICITICIISTVFLTSFLFFSYIKYIDAQKDISLQKERFKKLETDRRDLNYLLKGYAKDIARFETILFKGKDIPLFLERLSESSKKFNVRITDIKALPPQRVKKEEEAQRFKKRASKNDEAEAEAILALQAIPFDLKIKGRFEDIVKFLLSLERHRQLLTLRNVKIKISKYPLLESNFRLDLYSLQSSGGIERKK